MSGVYTWSVDAPEERQDGVLAWIVSSPQFKEDLFWCKVLYGLLSLPFFPFMIPVFLQVLTHCEFTGYNESGACVAFDYPAIGVSRPSRTAFAPVHRVLSKAVDKYGNLLPKNRRVHVPYWSTNSYEPPSPRDVSSSSAASAP